VVLLYGVSVAFAACAILISLGGSWVKGGAILGVTLVIVGLMRVGRYFDCLHFRGRNQARLFDPRTERLRRALPEVLTAAERAREEEDALTVLERVVGDAGCVAILVRWPGGVAYSFPPAASSLGKNPVRLAFPLGSERLARAEVEFIWQTEEGDPSVQSIILLQLVVDSVTTALERCRSALAPRLESEHPTTDAAPSAAMVPGSSRA
jgi:hypothetical protein